MELKNLNAVQTLARKREKLIEVRDALRADKAEYDIYIGVSHSNWNDAYRASGDDAKVRKHLLVGVMAEIDVVESQLTKLEVTFDD